MAEKKTPTITLNDGSKIPVFGLGTWKSKPGEVTQAVKDAIDVGYRHIDGAFLYQNENEVGDAIHAKIDEGVVKREDLFVVSKLWNTFHKPVFVPLGLKKTLTSLRLDYLDLYLIHFPMGYQEGGDLAPKDANGKGLYSNVDILETWKAMEECYKQGLVKSIGVSNFNSQQLQRILDNCEIKPSMNQIEVHPYLNQRKLIEFCKSKGIAVTAYSPLGSPDRPWAKPDDPKLLDDPKLVQLGKKYRKSPAQIVIRWAIQRDLIVIPKSVQKKRLAENINVFDFQLDQQDMDYINSMDCNGRCVAVEQAGDHKDYPFHIEF